MDKSDIADVLNEIATLLEIKGENPFKIRAYQNGARKLETLEEDLGDLVSDGKLKEVAGFGDALVQKITELYETGSLTFFEKLKDSVEPGLVSMLEIPGLGAKKIKNMHKELGVASIEELKIACESGAVAELKGFGKKTAEKILLGIENREAYGRRHLWWDAFEVAKPILDGLQSLPEVDSASHAGSLRRKRETVGDLDFIVGSKTPKPIMDWFVAQEGVKEVTARGETKSSVRFESGLQADLRVVPPEQFYFALHHFTGSKDHNVAMRQRALSRGMSLSEWGLKPVDEDDFSNSKVISSEEDLFKYLDLEYVLPELREGAGEIEAAESGKLPQLLDGKSIRGVFHNHTTASDGRCSLEEMTKAAQERGWEYWGTADHSKASFQANGLDDERVLEQISLIDSLNKSRKFSTYVFSGVECDILTDGSLDLDESTLMSLDYVVSSVHISMTQTEEDMTKRLIRAIEHPATTMLGHLTGRILLRREGYKVDVSKVVDAAIANGVIIEINANPRRLDMDWRFWRRAADKGLMTSINPDAHRIEHFDFVEAGVNVARKGWLNESHVFNTLSVDEVRKAFAKRRPALGRLKAV
ncbi:DNA polymerase/3'-5' exonuclease PolX [Pelagicoccus sp. SDUM812002]|uniref:DNA polymerase/3'-5' exonuclease PolX n=1 Tax=Pelagicoccus sp. SDUM812002 TaxID=3041266 RepID=UPI00280E56AC|nr:DNA polymerase/3'-5' exonuclease PolX [Pelagicoccus sp. SDUM812002]MDQ8185131.1 DNA polymerase/3'-5' exonuclease PolX [Pelagicoccus sp. SDUM812002]